MAADSPPWPWFLTDHLPSGPFLGVVGAYAVASVFKHPDPGVSDPSWDAPRITVPPMGSLSRVELGAVSAATMATSTFPIIVASVLAVRLLIDAS